MITTAFAMMLLFTNALSSNGFAQSVENGLAAYKKGDYASAVRQWRPLAEQGNREAQYRVALTFMRGHGVNRDVDEAGRWLRMSAAQGHADAQFLLGSMMEWRETGQDGSAALNWYRKAASQGHSEAMLRIGHAYSYGRGVDVDHEAASQWYRAAAELGEANAAFDLGFMYWHGQGVSSDRVEALKWFRISKAFGFSLGADIVKSAEEQMSPVQIKKAGKLVQAWLKRFAQPRNSKEN